MELIDILDEKGNKTGETKSRDEVHKTGLIHRTVHVWCVNQNNEILLQRRNKDLICYPNMWDISAAGHISSGDDSITSAIKETKEEIGLDVSPGGLEFLGQEFEHLIENNGTYIINEFHDVYLIKMDIPINQLHMQKEEVSDLKWIPLEEFRQWVKEKRTDLTPHYKEFDLLIKKLE